MKRFFIYAIIFLLPPFARAGGSIAGNGGGIAEKNLLFAFDHLQESFDLCRQNPACELNAEETTLLKKIQVSLSQERQNPSLIQFRSGKAKPGFFVLEGLPRVAKTGDHVGDPIYVNSDLLYIDVGAGSIRPVDIPGSISILVHELGHHHAVKDHLMLDVLGTKLQNFAQKQSLRSEIWNGEIVFTVIQLNLVHRDEDKIHINQIDQVLIAAGSDLVNLTPQILKSVHCPQADQVPLGLRIYNLHADHHVRYDPKTQVTTRPLSAWYILSCRTGEISDTGDLRFGLALKRKAPNGEPEFILPQSEFLQASCQKDQTACD